MQIKTLHKGLLLSWHNMGFLWWFLCAIVFIRAMEQGHTTCKWDRQLAKFFHEKAASSFVTAFPSEGTLLLHCIPAKNYLVLLRQDYPGDKLQECISFGISYCYEVIECHTLLRKKGEENMIKGRFVFTVLIPVLASPTCRIPEVGHLVPACSWVSHREYPWISLISLMV